MTALLWVAAFVIAALALYLPVLLLGVLLAAVVPNRPTGRHRRKGR